ncbi:hypothetical protein HN873_029834, partial [Arachis hypogaea]
MVSNEEQQRARKEEKQRRDPGCEVAEELRRRHWVHRTAAVTVADLAMIEQLRTATTMRLNGGDER